MPGNGITTDQAGPQTDPTRIDRPAQQAVAATRFDALDVTKVRLPTPVERAGTRPAQPRNRVCRAWAQALMLRRSDQMTAVTAVAIVVNRQATSSKMTAAA